MGKPALSIGIIFKNEIRCLERCLKSLQPLRDMVPCELVMADTGATDGSRQVAEKYADILFDFEWVNDFAAARNAVMDHSSGDWYLSIDCDEWLGGDVEQLAIFVRGGHEFKYGGITIRNYQTADLDKGGDYSDFTACRILKMSTGMRYVGAIHERWPSELDGTPKLFLLQNILLHHDGYVYADPQAAKDKMVRNMSLLRERLENDPENLITLLQCMESSDGAPEYFDYVEKAAEGVVKRWKGWRLFGPPILRYAALASFRNDKPEYEKYIGIARELFPQSIYTCIDVEFAALGLSWKRSEYKNCIQSGEKYLKSLADYEAGNYDRTDSLTSTVALSGANWKTQVEIFTAASYLYEHQPEKAVNILSGLHGGQMTVKHVGDSMRVYTHLHSRSDQETAPLIVKLWDEISQPTPDEDRAKQRKTEFVRMSADVFLPAYWADECTKEDFHRRAYTLFLPLEGKCVLGDAAAILETSAPALLEEKLGRTEDINLLPVSVLYHALEHGADFPLADKPMKLEQMDLLAGRLSQDKDRLFKLALRETENIPAGNRQKLAWARGLALAAVHAFDWTGKGDGVPIARAYVKAEQRFLPACYAPETLRKENLDILPPMHRFGWYLVQAFESLDGGNETNYVRLLREGLETCPEMKPMVEFLLTDLEEKRRTQAAPELLALAEQVRAILSQYPADDPAVAALKQSEAYQTVAHLIEGPDLGILGGLPQ